MQAFSPASYFLRLCFRKSTAFLQGSGC